MNGLLAGAMPQPPQQQQAGGLLGGIQQAPSGGAMPMPPEMMQAIEQMKSAPPEEREAFIQQVTQAIQSAPKDQAQKQQVLQQFMQAMGGQ